MARPEDAALFLLALAAGCTPLPDAQSAVGTHRAASAAPTTVVLPSAGARPPAGADRAGPPAGPAGEHARRPHLAALLARMDSADVTEAIEAAEALARIPAAEEASVAFLGRKLESPEAEVRERAVVLLGRTQFPSAIPVLVSALSDPESNVRNQASSELSELGTPALAPLMAALADPDARRRGMAALTLRHMDPEARAALPRLRALAEDADVEVQQSALLALGDLSREDEDKAALLPLLLARMEHQDPHIRETAVFVLRRALVPGFPQVVPYLIRALSDTNASVQVEAAFALGELGPAARAAVPRLRQVATIHVCGPLEPCVDEAAREALRRIGP